MNARSIVWPLQTRAILAATLAGVSSLAAANVCSVDPVPAATLLVPYFEVDTTCGGSDDTNTRFTLTNVDAAPVLSRVQLWTNTGVPLFSFDIYLNGYDQQDIDMHALLCDGVLPVTGSGLPPGEGRLAMPPQNFSGCNVGTTPGSSPVYDSLPSEATALYRAALSGQELTTLPGQCAAIANGRGTADGYITVDAVTSCNAPNRGQGSFGAALSDRNVLAGTATLIDNVNNSSFSVPVIGLEASDALADSDSFYGDAAVNVGVRREPLPAAWSVESGPGVGALSQTEFVVWRAPPFAGSNFACGMLPTGFPLPLDNKTGYGSRGVFHVSDAGKATPTVRTSPLPLAAQRVAVAQEFPATAAFGTGWTFMNLYRQLGGQNIPAQAWTGLVRRSPGRFETLTAGSPMDTACNGSDFSTISPGPFQIFAGDPMSADRHISLSADAANVIEGGTLTVTVALAQPADQNIDVQLLLGGGLESQTTAFTGGTISSGSSSLNIPLLFDDDGVFEPGFTGSIGIDYLFPAANHTIAAPGELSIGFSDND